jgi:hypothetical protein
VYPPGQFSPWNSPELRTAAGRPGHSAGLGPDPDEPGYSQLAVSDPSADATSTQTWAVLDEAQLSGEWTIPPAKSPSQPGPGTAPSGTGPSGTGLSGTGPRGSFEAAAAGAPWDAEPPAGRTGLAAADGQRPDPARPSYPGAPGEPRPGGRLAARRSREAAQDAGPDTAAGTRNRGTGGFGTGDIDTGGFSTGGFGTGDIDTGDIDTGDIGTGGFGTGGFDTGDIGTGGFDTGGFDTGGFSTGEFDTGGFSTGGFDTGGFDTGGFSTGEFGSGGFPTGGSDTSRFGGPAEPGTRAGRDAAPAGAPTRGSRSAARGRTPRQPRKPVSRVKMWLMPAGMLVLVGALIAVVYMEFGTGHAGHTGNAASATQRPAAPASSAPAGPWKHITTRRDDPTALGLAELFPARFSAGGTTAVRTAQRASRANCAKMVLGGKLQAALRKGGCTQVMRASYLATGQKIMATIGVLNLANVTDSEQAGRATGATAFIRQLPGARGPTRNLMKGTGLEEAEIKGHYLILTWAEFTNLKAPKGPKQRAQLDTFSRELVGSTANVSLTSRELLGKPATP